MQFGWLIALSVISSVIAQTSFKLGMSGGNAGEAPTGLVALVSFILHSPLVLTGLFLYGIGALAWIAVLSRLHLSYAYPFLALNFVLIALTSHFVLGETVPVMRWVGIAIICIGIFVVARSGSS